VPVPQKTRKPQPPIGWLFYWSKKMQKTQSKEEIIAAIQECAKELGHTPSFPELYRRRKITRRLIYEVWGGYRKALEASGLTRRGPGYRAVMAELFEDWAGLVRDLGKVPTMREYEAREGYSIRPLTRRFGGWRLHVPAAMLEYARRQGLEGEWKDVLDVVHRHIEGGIDAVGPRTMAKVAVMNDQGVYGAPLSPGPLAFAPTHEGGVLFLFGTLAEELGFAVLRIQPSFPDCEAMREVSPGKWQWVRIEFELESRNFLAHGHPVAGCDVIVCWNHNWENCPLEVVELRKLVGKGVSPQIYADERK
jgi:Homing endonuclease associated repeat